MHGGPALCRAVALLALALAGHAADALAAPNKGVLGITPARRDITGRPPLRLSPTEVRNTTEVDMKVTVFPVLLVQNLDGTFAFNADPADLNAAKLQLSVGPTAFKLAPQQGRTLSLRWNLLPRTAKAAYLGIVIQGVPQLPGGKQVGTILRLLSVNFLSRPGRFEIKGHLTGLRGEQAGPRVLQFFPRVRNTGQIHGQPRGGRCVITDAGGAEQLAARFGTGVVLPGYEREYPIVVRKILPAGSYRMTCAMAFGKTRSHRSLDFKLSGPNTLPTPDLKLVRAAGEAVVGGDAKVTVTLRNRGAAATNAFLRVTLKSLTPSIGTRTLDQGRFPQGRLAGAASKTVTLTLGKKLAAGTYVADVVLSNGKEDVDELTASFVAKKHKGLLARIWDWIKHHLAWLIALIALIAFLSSFLAYRRRRREMEKELAAARATPPPAAAPPPPPPEPVTAPAPAPPAEPTDGAPAGRVNLNTADVETLMTLPGVGRRAAERIVGHREAHGPYSSLDDLHAVEGFHEERILRIADSAEV